ncbi:MAG TPA: sigma-70 family RNA polymerase sigma factor [Candidatus Saccharimonadales bacterium]|nr:sigma-70 family RNA polymerase sigma factor [Candidatus Saccharimonadales bacterium]
MSASTALAVGSHATDGAEIPKSKHLAAPAGYPEDLKLAQQALTGPPSRFEALCVRFAPMIRVIVERFYLQDGSEDDLRQEAMLGLYKGIRDYDGKRSSLAIFVELCITRQVITAVKTATRGKHMPLNQAARFHQPYGNEGLTLASVIEDPKSSIAQQIEDREQLRGLFQVINNKLSKLEYQEFRLWVGGVPYEEIASYLSANQKTVDNALQRVKRKLEQPAKPTPPERMRIDMRESPEVEALVQCIIAAGGEFEDKESGHATSKLATALGKSRKTTTQLLYRAVKQGRVETDTRGKRTYSIRVAGKKVAPAPAVAAGQPGAQAGAGKPATQPQPAPPQQAAPLDYGVLGASLLKQVTVAINEHDALTGRVAELDAEVQRLQESNARLEGTKADLEEELKQLRAEIKAQPATELDEDAREDVDRALRLVS